MPPPTKPGFWSFILDNSLPLIVGAVAALGWANLAHASYERVARALHFAVNDIGMVFFFALAAKEIVEATRRAVCSRRRGKRECRCSPPRAA